MIKKIHNKIYLVSKVCGKKIGLDLPYFIKNGFWVAVRQGIGAISGLALSVAFARLASQEVFGQYQFVLSVLSIVALFSVPGLNTSLIQSVARGCDGDYRRVVKTSFMWSLLGIPALLVVGMYYYSFQSHSLGIAFMIASIFFPFFYAPNTWDSFLQGKSRFDVLARYASVQAIINSVVTALVVFFFHENLIFIIVIYLISHTFFNGYYYYKSLEYIKNDEREDDTLKYGWFLTRIGVLNVIASNIDKIVVGIFLSQAQLAVYSVGILFSKQVQNITKSLLGITVPKQIKQGDISSRNYFKIFIISSGVLVCFWAFSPFLISFLFSEKYAEAVFLTRISFLFYPIFVLSIIYKNKFIFGKKERNIKIESISSPIIRIMLMFIVLPVYGMAGMAFLVSFQYFITIATLYFSDSVLSRQDKKMGQ
jgi:O-antigen/teichoic acid export membrane protein